MFCLALLAGGVGGSLLSALESKEPLIPEERAFPDFDLPGIGSAHSQESTLHLKASELAASLCSPVAKLLSL